MITMTIKATVIMHRYTIVAILLQILALPLTMLDAIPVLLFEVDFRRPPFHADPAAQRYGQQILAAHPVHQLVF